VQLLSFLCPPVLPHGLCLSFMQVFHLSTPEPLYYFSQK
jgi:hypothetical protein